VFFYKKRSLKGDDGKVISKLISCCELRAVWNKFFRRDLEKLEKKKCLAYADTHFSKQVRDW
jgi:hypothetical protein